MKDTADRESFDADGRKGRVEMIEKNYSGYASVMKALGDETRIRIFHMLSQGELCACDILEAFKITQPTLSYHMKILVESGMVQSRKAGTWTRYSINKEVLGSLTGFLDGISESIERQTDGIRLMEG